MTFHRIRRPPRPYYQPILLLALLLAQKLRPIVTSASSSSSSRTLIHPIAFAGGFGKRQSTTARTEKKKKTKRGFPIVGDDVKVTDAPSTASEEGSPQLDKWGLPPPTIEDIFPPLSMDTELIPVDKETYSLQEIQHALRNHMLMSLEESFDQDATEAIPATDGTRRPMKIRLLHVAPPVLEIENFFTRDECEEVKQVAMPDKDSAPTRTDPQQRAVQIDSKTFSPLAQSKRTSTSWFCYYAQVPVLLAKARHRLGIPLDRMEEPQIVRYQTGQEFSWHYDEVPPPQLPNGGQRLVTLLVYLNTVQQGGGTIFRDLRDTQGHELTVQPKEGNALLFFPALADGTPDDRTLHKGQAALDEKHIIQMWIHERPYKAAVPPDNRQKDAQAAVDQVSRALGYIE